MPNTPYASPLTELSIRTPNNSNLLKKSNIAKNTQTQKSQKPNHDKITFSKSSKNLSNKQLTALRQKRNSRRQLPSVENRIINRHNKENLKFPQILKNPIIANKSAKAPSTTKKPQKDKKSHSSKKISTQPAKYPLLELQHLIQSQKYSQDIKKTLLDILNTESRKSITIDGQMQKLNSLTKKSGTLRKHLISIQEDMLEIGLKKKLNKMNRNGTNCSLVLKGIE